MTTPGPSPAGGSSQGGPPVETKRRSKRICVLWAVALGLLLAAGLFSWLVAVPYLRARAAVADMRVFFRTSGVVDEAGFNAHARKLIQGLGGEDRAIAALTLYFRAPRTSPEDRASAAYLLGYCGRSAVPALIVALGDPEPGVRQWAARALGRIGPEAEDAVPALIKSLGDPYRPVHAPASLALSRIGKPAVAPLTRLLNHADWELRFNAAWTLGRIGPAAAPAVPALERLSRDEQELVRRQAAWALKKIRAAAGEKKQPPPRNRP